MFLGCCFFPGEGQNSLSFRSDFSPPKGFIPKKAHTLKGSETQVFPILGRRGELYSGSNVILTDHPKADFNVTTVLLLSTNIWFFKAPALVWCWAKEGANIGESKKRNSSVTFKSQENGCPRQLTPLYSRALIQDAPLPTLSPQCAIIAFVFMTRTIIISTSRLLSHQHQHLHCV